jgi:hypothetical protein
MYSVKPGAMDEWCREWRDLIRPLRERHGFKVSGGWVIDETSQFVWMLEYDGPEEWQAVDARYYGSPERKAMAPDPARNLEKTEHWFVREV